jgi:hypothetical protein
LPGPDDGGDYACLTINLPDSATPGITDVQVVVRINRHVQREIKAGFSTGSIISAITRFSIASEVMHETSMKIHSPDTIRPTFGKVEVVFLLIEAHMVGQGNARFHRPLPITGTPGLPVTGKRFNKPKL